VLGTVYALPHPLGAITESGSGYGATWTNSGFCYDFAIAGLPFLRAESAQRPYERALAQSTKDQFDSSSDPGEQTLSEFWVRSQRDFSGGAGIKFLEPAGDERVMRSFRESSMVDVWTPGELTLLHSLEEIADFPSGSWIKLAAAATTTGEPRLLIAAEASPDYMHIWDGTTDLGAVVDPGADPNPGVGRYLCSLGDSVLSSQVRGLPGDQYVTVTRTDITTADRTVIYEQAGTEACRLWWVKQRAVAALGTSLYELGLVPGSGALPTAFYVHPIANWSWVGVAEAPGAILAAGYAGAKGAIYKFVLDEAGDLPTLTGAITVAEFPVGEYPTGLATYLGKYVVIGTNKGVRVGQMSDAGEIQYGPLSWSGDGPVEHFTFRDSYVYCGVTAGVNGNSGLVRIDLGDMDETGRCPWANDLEAAGETGVVDDVSTLGATDRLCIGIRGVGMWAENEDTYAEAGWLTTGFVRFNTTEPKLFHSVRVGSPEGSITVSTVNRHEVASSIATVGGNIAAGQDLRIRHPAGPEEFLGFRFDLASTADDSHASTPLLDTWQVKAVPAVERQELLRIPLLCFDYEQDRYGIREGGSGSALARYQALVAAVSEGTPVTLQDLTTDEQLEVKVDGLEFAQTAPPNAAEGFGGIIYLTARSL